MDSFKSDDNLAKKMSDNFQQSNTSDQTSNNDGIKKDEVSI